MKIKNIDVFRIISLALAFLVLGLNIGYFVFGVEPFIQCKKAVAERDEYIRDSCTFGNKEYLYLKLEDEGINDTVWLKKGTNYFPTNKTVNVSKWI